MDFEKVTTKEATVLWDFDNEEIIIETHTGPGVLVKARVPFETVSKWAERIAQSPRSHQGDAG